MKWMTCRTVWTGLSLSLSVLFAPTALAFNYVVDGLNGDDLNGGISATGGATDLAGLDFSDAFQTIGQATSVTAPGDFIFVNAGEYSEEVEPTAETTLVAVGEVVIVNTGSVGLRVSASTVTVDGFAIRNSGTGVFVTGLYVNGILLSNLTISSCGTGVNFSQLQSATMVRCVITDCSARAVSMRDRAITIEQCTIVGNLVGVYALGTPGHVFRNNIVAFNTNDGIQGLSGGLVDFNDVFGNGTDYVGVMPGPNDVSVYPQFVDLSRRILHLQPTSLLINAGEKLGGGPRVTIGARDIGHASSDRLDGWADWIDENGVLLTSGLSTLVEIEPASGHVILKPGVNRASVRSPVFTGSLKSLEFGALEDQTPGSGNRCVIDQVDATVQRELGFRGSDSSFSATDPAPAFTAIFEGQVLESIFRFVQVELTLTTNGL